MKRLPRSKGYMMWKVIDAEGGDLDSIVTEAVAAKFSHVQIKVANGTADYNISSNVPLLRDKLGQAGIEVWGWHYIYGYDPLNEARKASERIDALDLDGYVFDAEVEFKQIGWDKKATVLGTEFRLLQPTICVGLSSYRRPDYHKIPWVELRRFVDFDQPQVYWEQSTNAAEQLRKSFELFSNFEQKLPFIPTGSAYKAGTWVPTVSQILEFLATAEVLGCTGVNFWEWAHTRRYLPNLWTAIANYNYPVPAEPPPPPEPDPGPEDDMTGVFDQLDALLNKHPDAAVHVHVYVKDDGTGETPNPGPEPTPGGTRYVVTDNRARTFFGPRITDIEDTDSAIVQGHYVFIGEQLRDGTTYFGKILDTVSAEDKKYIGKWLKMTDLATA